MAIALVLLSAAPAAAETPRERCRTMTERAGRAEAIAACDEVLAAGGSAEDMWAAAAVRVARPELPTMDDLIRADQLATAAARLAPGEPWGSLAHLDLARRWGAPELIARRLEELERVAPADPRTVRARALVRSSSRPELLLGWGALAVVCALTLGHALRRGMAQRARPRAAALLAVAVLATLELALPRAAAAEVFAIDDARPEDGVPTPAEADARPLDFAHYLQDLTERAAAAAARADHAAAVRYYRALARAVPDSSVPQQRLCTSLLALGEADAALSACQAALGLPGARAEDLVRFGDLVLARAAPTAAQLADVEAAARHLAGQPGTRVLGLQLECRLGVRLASQPLLEECTAGLATAAPDEASTFVFQWSLAQLRGQVEEARRLIERARAAGLGEDGLARMQAATASGESATPRRLLAGAGLAAVLLGLYLMARGRRGRRQWTTTISGSS